MSSLGSIAVDVHVEVAESAEFPDWQASDWGTNLQRWSAIWLEAMPTNLPPALGYEYAVRLTGDREIQQFNAQYRHIDRPTDVLSFPTLEVDTPSGHIHGDEPFYLGDIIISVEMARRQVGDLDRKLQGELTWLSVHGLLHLIGWDHPDEASLERMLAQQETLLSLVGLDVHNFRRYR